MDHANASGAGVERHFDARGVAVETDCRANSQFGVSFIDDRDGGLSMSEDVLDAFESE